MFTRAIVLAASGELYTHRLYTNSPRCNRTHVGIGQSAITIGLFYSVHPEVSQEVKVSVPIFRIAKQLYAQRCSTVSVKASIIIIIVQFLVELVGARGKTVTSASN